MTTAITQTGRRDFVPQNALRFREWVRNLIEYLTPYRATQYGIPTTTMSELKGLLDSFLNAQDELPNDPTRAQIAYRNKMQRELTALVRFVIRFYLRRPTVTDPELIAMGIPPIDRIRTMHKVVTETVDFSLHISGIRRVIVDFWQMGVEHSKAKPRGYDGAVLIWNIGRDRPAEASNFEHHTMASRRPFIIEFDDEQRGKTVWVALAWQNERGIRGEWSEFKSAVIP